MNDLEDSDDEVDGKDGGQLHVGSNQQQEQEQQRHAATEGPPGETTIDEERAATATTTAVEGDVYADWQSSDDIDWTLLVNTREE